MENLYVVMWVLMRTPIGTRQSHVADTLYTQASECEKAKMHNKGWEEYCFKVMLPLSKFREIKEVGNAEVV